MSKATNYTLMVIIVLILAYFFKRAMYKTASTIGGAATSLMPKVDFIYAKYGYGDKKFNYKKIISSFKKLEEYIR